jgi:mono/diheme cytochrome c family protein
MEDSLFYIAGGALIVVALVVSLVGMRGEKFPSGALLKGGILVIALLVATTGYGAVKLAEGEQADRRDEANKEADLEEQQQNVQDQGLGDTTSPAPPTNGGGSTDQAATQIDASKIFISSGCGSCHTLAELGSQAQGTIGPNLDQALIDKDTAFIKQSIEDPSAVVEAGYPDGTMPSDFSQQLSPAEIDALVAYLSKAAGSNN